MKGAQLRKPITHALALGLAGFMLCLPVAQACTRLTYLGDNQTVITARSMDWKTDVATNLWIFPRVCSVMAKWAQVRSSGLRVMGA